MTQITMYSGFNNSPKTKLTADITFNDTVIPVESVSVFPEGPNLATIGAGNDAELIRYASISGNNLIGCERGFYGTTASAWYSETKIARYFSRYDADAMKNNIEDLVSDKVSDADLGDLALLDTVGNTQIDAMPANTIKGNNLSTSSSPDDLTVDETVEMIFGGLSAETTPAPIDTDKFISEITRSSTVSRVLVTFATIKNYILGALFSTSTGHSHNGSDSKKISGSDLNSVVPVTLGGTDAVNSADARDNLDAAPNDAGYLVSSSDSELTNGLVLTAGAGVSLEQDNVAHTLEVSVNETITTNKYYIDQSSGTADSYGILSGSVNGTNYTFTVSQGKYISGSLEVYLNGQLQTQGSSEDWVEANPLNGSFSFNTAPISGDLITAKYLITSIVTVGEGSDIDVAFSEASSISNINTGETLSTIFGKIKKFFNNLTGHDHDGTNSKKIAAENVDGLSDYFNTSTGHDHDGTDSKHIAYSNITGTPTVREILTANRTYYVRIDGNDSNSGLTNETTGAFLTIQKAVNTVAELDINGKTVVIQVGAGTYTEDIVLKMVIGYTSPGTLLIIGDESTPSNVIINSTYCFYCSNIYCTWILSGFKLISSNTSIYVSSANLQFKNIDFGLSSGYHIVIDNALSGITACGDYSISGGAVHHIVNNNGGSIVIPYKNILILNDLSFIGSFILASSLSSNVFPQTTITTGSYNVTGKRYIVELNAIIQTYGKPANYFPGTLDGSSATGGLYV